MKLHSTQEKILNFIERNGGTIEDMTLRDIGESIGIGRQPQLVAHHLQQLEKKGYLRRDPSDQRRMTTLKAPIPEVAYVDLYGMAECGPEGFFGEDCILDRIPLPTRTFGISDPRRYFLVTARGKSMEPMIKEGDLILAVQQDDVDSGSVAVVVHNNMPKIKKVVVNELGGNRIYSLISLNNEFKDENITSGDENFRIVGLIKGVIHTPKQPAIGEL